jgi:4-aminobutyrate aminotransferase-like enzyme
MIARNWRQAAGHYFTHETLPNEPYRNFNTWVGDMPRVLQANVIIDEIRKGNLVENARITGTYIMVKRCLNPLALARILKRN